MTPEEFCWIERPQRYYGDCRWGVRIVGTSHYVGDLLSEENAKHLCDTIRATVQLICQTAIKKALEQVVPPNMEPEHIIRTVLDNKSPSIQNPSRQ